MGNEDSRLDVPLPDNIIVDFRTAFSESQSKPYEAVILDRTPDSQECAALHWVTKAHTLFVTDRVDLSACRYYFTCKCGQQLGKKNIVDFLQQDAQWFFHTSYGEKYVHKALAVSRNFNGQISWKGSYSIQLTGDFGKKMTQTAFWRGNIPLMEGQAIDFWLEYKKTPGVTVSLKGILFERGSISTVLKQWEFTERELGNVVTMQAEKPGFLFVSIYACGTGSLEIFSLHDRYSRKTYGYFLPGGDRYVTSDRREIFCYFDPGDLKPPLCVYFSGYKTREGFEGYNLMRSMGVPFLLVSDCLLEGGGFYIGPDEYEELYRTVLKKYMDILHFGPQDVILSGISMGSTGALYYGCDFCPHAIIVGKPLVNLGDIAMNEKRNRPNGFPTSLDLLLSNTGDTTNQAIVQLNQRFWTKFRKTDWSQTKLIISYMLEDDYDMSAYNQMIQELSAKDAHIYGRGLHGRHNDNTSGIVQWFSSQYHKILREDFAEYNNPLRQGIDK